MLHVLYLVFSEGYTSSSGAALQRTDLANEASSRHVVSAVVNLARAFSMRTIAEGVEDDVTLEILKELGVDFAQGYFIAPPGPAADMLGCGVGGSGESSLAG